MIVDITVGVEDFPIQKNDFCFTSDIDLNGGGRCNFLIALSRLQVKTAAIDVIGKDRWGDYLLEILVEEGIDVSLVQRDSDTSRTIVLCDNSGNHTFLGKFANNSPYQIRDEYHAAISRASAVFASGYNFQDKNSTELTLKIFRAAREKDIIRGLDTGPVFNLLDKEMREKIYLLCTHIFLTEEELMLLDEGNLSEFFKNGVDAVIIKRGADGCKVVSSNGDSFSIRGLKVPIVDTVAAGDCFAAGFMAGLLNGLPLESCAKLANCVGAAKVKKMGSGYNVPTMDEVMELYKEFDLSL